jgi:hypothetical protein
VAEKFGGRGTVENDLGIAEKIVHLEIVFPLVGGP